MQQASISRPLKYVSLIFSTIIGVTFIASGFLKAVDPWGTAIKFEEYFAIYGFGSLMPLADALAIWLCGAEMMMGFMMLFKVRLRLISIFALISMSAFTVITLLSATVLPVEDCGCFGDVISLTAWQSFFKNLIILPMVIVVWYRYRPDRIFAFKRREAVMTFVFCIGAMGFSIYNYIHLPMIDFLPYKVGVDLLADSEEASVVPQVILVYKNIESGELKEFAITDTEWQDDSKWEWVETRDEARRTPSNKLSISDFTLRNIDGEDVTESLLVQNEALDLVCVTTFDRVRKPCLKRIEEYISRSESLGNRVIVVTPQRFEQQNHSFSNGSVVEMYNIDDVTLKALLRATNGVVEVRNGVISAKISCADL